MHTSSLTINPSCGWRRSTHDLRLLRGAQGPLRLHRQLALPLIVVFLFFQRQIIRGAATTGLTGT